MSPALKTPVNYRVDLRINLPLPPSTGVLVGPGGAQPDRPNHGYFVLYDKIVQNHTCKIMHNNVYIMMFGLPPQVYSSAQAERSQTIQNMVNILYDKTNDAQEGVVSMLLEDMADQQVGLGACVLASVCIKGWERGAHVWGRAWCPCCWRTWRTSRWGWGHVY